MEKYKVIIIDESGVIDSKEDKDRYFTLGGIIYDYTHLEVIKSKLVPILKEYLDILKIDEFKSSKMTNSKNDHNLIYGSILTYIKECEYIKSFIYIIDTKSSSIMQFYSKKSFRYNKVIQWMLQDMKRSSLIEVDDQYKLLLDNVSLDKVEEENFKTWLKNHIAGVISLDMADSKNYYFLQIADLIAVIPKLTGKKPDKLKDNTKIKILKPDLLHIFPNEVNTIYNK